MHAERWLRVHRERGLWVMGRKGCEYIRRVGCEVQGGGGVQAGGVELEDDSEVSAGG